MKGFAALLAWAALGGAIGWVWAAIKAALLASDPGWESSFLIFTGLVWILGLLLGCGRLARFWDLRKWQAIALGLVAVFLCALGELAHDYRRSGTTATPSDWWAEASQQRVTSAGRRRVSSIPRWLVLAIQTSAASFLVGAGSSRFGD